MKQGFSRRLMVCGSLVVFGFCMLGVKLSIIQIRDRDRLVAYAERQLRRTLVVRPRRGGRRGREGPTSGGEHQRALSFRQRQGGGRPLEHFAGAQGNPGRLDGRLFQKIERPPQICVAQRKINPDQKRRIEKLGIDGLGFVTESRRFYPKRELASSLVGFVGVDDAGMYGVEQSYQEHMAGAWAASASSATRRAGRFIPKRGFSWPRVRARTFALPSMRCFSISLKKS